MDADIIEKPSSKILYRQSSVETRLSPVHLSDEDTSDEENVIPKIIDYKLKPFGHLNETRHVECVTELSTEINLLNTKNVSGNNDSNNSETVYRYQQEFSAGKLKGELKLLFI